MNDCMPSPWNDFLEGESMEKVTAYLNEHNDFEPKEIFKAFDYCPFEKCRVVILGDRPYLNGNATGIAFANKKEVRRLSPTLKIFRKVFNESMKERGRDDVFDTTLETYSKKGILFLNTTLTTSEENFNEHASLWKPIIEKFLIKYSSEYNNLFIFVGKETRKFMSYIDDSYSDKLFIPFATSLQRNKCKLGKEILTLIEQRLEI